jgi:hypothetical protein
MHGLRGDRKSQQPLGWQSGRIALLLTNRPASAKLMQAEGRHDHSLFLP